MENKNKKEEFNPVRIMRDYFPVNNLETSLVACIAENGIIIGHKELSKDELDISRFDVEKCGSNEKDFFLNKKNYKIIKTHKNGK